MSSLENLVSGTNSPTHQGARATNYNCVHLVHLQSAIFRVPVSTLQLPKEQGEHRC